MKIPNRPDPALYLLLACLCIASTSCSTSNSKTGAAASPSPSPTAQDLIAQADKLYAQREDLMQARQAITTIRQARMADYSSYEAAWRLSKFNYFLGSHTKDEGEREKAFHDGVEAGQAAVKLQPEKAEGHFWLGANYGGQAQTNALTGLASIEDIRTEMETVIRLDKGFQSGSAYMVLGQLYLEAPKLLGGDPQKAVQVLEQGTEFGKNNGLLHLRLAQAYLAVKRKEDARKTLNAILTMTPHPDYLPEYKEAATEARKLLDAGL